MLTGEGASSSQACLVMGFEGCSIVWPALLRGCLQGRRLCGPKLLLFKARWAREVGEMNVKLIVCDFFGLPRFLTLSRLCFERVKDFSPSPMLGTCRNSKWKQYVKR